MLPRVYVETTIISYLAARMSSNIVAAARQQITHHWWNRHRRYFELYISESVIREIEVGDSRASAKRLTLVEGLPRLEVNDDVSSLAKLLLSPQIIPKEYPEDAVHLALATVHRMDFLLTWNFRHLANAQIAKAAYDLLSSNGWVMPVICTPESLPSEIK
ncbi:MAG: type II toxin-antitoxin system VapC family toxin [Phycisphaerales bacterium]|nr:type II toxin-antitoxin system VapC family toxin [Phycisphaerales bacterium]